MAKIWMGPTGQIIKGHVLDVHVPSFVRTLKDYDKQLYVRWNPNKARGWGCWEIRREPNTKSVQDIVNFEGKSFVVIDWVEFDLENHILDCAFLNYDQLRKLKEMDTWAQGNPAYFVDRLESKEASHREEVARKNKEELRYNIRQFKREFREYKDAIASGVNPAEIMRHWGKT